METFTLAAVSLIVAVALTINKRKIPLHISFAALCLALFFYKGGAFVFGIFKSGVWQTISEAGLIFIAPLSLRFTRLLLAEQSLISSRDFTLAVIFSFIITITLITPLKAWPYMYVLIWLFTASALTICYVSLLIAVRKKTVGVEKKRFFYLAIACGATVFFSLFDLLNYFGYDSPLFSDILISALIYFIMMFITHTHIIEIQELLARAMFIAILTLFATITIFLVNGLFGKGVQLPFTHVMLASFMIVIAIDPFREVMKKIFSALYPDSRELFASLYAFDEKIEREKTMMLEEMAPVLAHEIRNPLGSIKGAAQYLKSETDTPENQRLLDVIIEEANRLNRVVTQFLDYAKPYTLNIRMTDINQIIEKAVSIIKANNISESINIEQDLRPQLPFVKVDQEQLMQVILNIAFNAIEAMPEGGTLVFRTTKIESDTGEAVGIAIRDTGKGISRDDIKSIFKPFYTTKERGVGLGLAISRKIIRTHGGNIRVKSIAGQGSIFYIRIGAAY